jgi:hypothetical protein
MKEIPEPSIFIKCCVRIKVVTLIIRDKNLHDVEESSAQADRNIPVNKDV